MKKGILNAIAILFVGMELALLVLGFVSRNQRLTLLSMPHRNRHYELSVEQGILAFRAGPDGYQGCAFPVVWESHGIRCYTLYFTSGNIDRTWFASEFYAAGVLGIPTLLLGIPAAWRHGQSRRLKLAGCCRRCGYDLRASIGRCPECGRAIPAAALPATL